MGLETGYYFGDGIMKIFMTLVAFMIGTLIAIPLGFGLEWGEFGLVTFYLLAFSIVLKINGSVA